MGGQLPILDVNPKDIQGVFHQLGRMLNITAVGTLLFVSVHEGPLLGPLWQFLTMGIVFSQGHYSRLALREIGPFLRYMESEFNIKVHVGRIQI